MNSQVGKLMNLLGFATGKVVVAPPLQSISQKSVYIVAINHLSKVKTLKKYLLPYFEYSFRYFTV